MPHTIAAQTRAMLAWMKTHAGGRLGAGEVGRTWIWLDLHLDHAEAVWCFNRPFWTSAASTRRRLACTPSEESQVKTKRTPDAKHRSRPQGREKQSDDVSALGGAGHRGGHVLVFLDA